MAGGGGVSGQPENPPGYATGLGQDGAYIAYVLCLSVTKLFLVLFKYFIVIIKKLEMLYVVLDIIAC